MRSVRPPAWTVVPLVACEGGPLDGQWFTAEDWRIRVQGARRMRAAGSPGGTPSADYVREGTVRHPHQPTTGTRYRYRPTTR